eukprot:6529395-Pyramimonas_sp.AAC.1
MGDKAWDFILTQTSYDFFGLAETHIGPADVGRWSGKARGHNIRLFHNAARPSSKAASPEVRHDSPGESQSGGHANEG